MVSIRYLFSKKRESFVSFMSLISISGVAVGVACLITVLAVMNGFGYELRKRIVGSNPHLIIEKENGIKKDDYKLFSEKIKAITHIEGAYPYIWGQGVLRFRSRAQGVVIRSIDTDNKTDMSKLKDHIQAGDLNPGKDGIILGSELSAALGVFIGDEIRIITSSSKGAKNFKVRGVFTSGMYEYDLNLAYVNLSTASILFDMSGSVSGIGIDIDNIDNAVFVKGKLREILAPSYYVRTWMDLNKNLFSALKLEKWAMFVILTLIVIVAALNIVSTLTVTVTQKAKDIGILKAIGSTKKAIITIFSLQGIIIGFCGAAIGTWALERNLKTP